MKDARVSRCKYRRSFAFYVDNNLRPNSVDNEIVATHYTVTINTTTSVTLVTDFTYSNSYY